jgi:hypothetical protein
LDPLFSLARKKKVQEGENKASQGGTKRGGYKLLMKPFINHSISELFPTFSAIFISPRKRSAFWTMKPYYIHFE